MKVSKQIILVFVIITLSACQISGYLSDYSNETSVDHKLTLNERLEIEKTTVHWLPYKRILVQELADGTEAEECWERPRAIDEFPQGFWTREERLQGRFIIHIFAAVYLFIVLAFICDKYFLPTVERICEVLQISQDVAASTFMATATTIPEFFANTISTFVADSDMGLSAIIGSMMFNTLGVAACASLFTKKPIQIDWWPITRDSIIFSFNITILVIMAWDGVIMWYETCVLVVLYVGYWILMFQNPRIMKFVKHVVEDRLMWCQRIKNYDIVNQRPFDIKIDSGVVVHQPKSKDENGTNRESYKTYENNAFDHTNEDIATIEAVKARNRSKSFDINAFELPKDARARRASTDLSIVYADEEENGEWALWEIPQDASKFDIFWFFFTWPIRFSLHYTIPNPIKYKKWYVMSFIMCIVWIACVSYLIFWMVVIVGDVFNIPEAVMGLTFLAFGGCMPEAISAVIVARKGSGQMGVSNALGANSLAVLFSLGLPWFIRTMADGAGFNNAKIRIFSHGIEFTIMGLLLAVATLYIAISVAGYKLRKKVGGVLALGYIFLATFAILVELDVFFEAPDRC